MNLANTVITQDNSSLQSMGTDQLLDLFSLDIQVEQSKKDSERVPTRTEQKTSVQNILDNMEELWDEKQYETEYNLDTFMESLLTEPVQTSWIWTQQLRSPAKLARVKRGGLSLAVLFFLWWISRKLSGRFFFCNGQENVLWITLFL